MKRATHEVPASDGKRVKTGASAFGSTPQTAHLIGRITDSHLLKQRQKQVDFGKNTIDYARYSKLVPRFRRTPEDPTTPDISDPMSKRRFDGKVKAWRRQLHAWGNANPAPEASTGASTSTTTGLAGCADDFDAYLDGALDEMMDDVDDDRDVLEQLQGDQESQTSSAKPQPTPHPHPQSSSPPPQKPSPELITAVEASAAAAPPVGTETTDEHTSLRKRLDAFKKQPTESVASKSGPSGASAAGGGSIFGAFDDGLTE